MKNVTLGEFLEELRNANPNVIVPLFVDSQCGQLPNIVKLFFPDAECYVVGDPRIHVVIKWRGDFYDITGKIPENELEDYQHLLKKWEYKTVPNYENNIIIQPNILKKFENNELTVDYYMSHFNERYEPLIQGTGQGNFIKKRINGMHSEFSSMKENVRKK